MASLKNTKWTLDFDGTPGTVEFDFNPSQVPPGASGGTGTIKVDGTTTPIVWVENGSSFMMQQQNQGGVATLTTAYGTHANKAGSGWNCNFLINFALTDFSMTKVS